ncbi:DUF732 domain-containing protein [Mycobacterium vicinigordonae]|uniref:DUF732 domain-containing protein n=1 Tax=Mycobacterium vicinigordonae TaxID=1719132 RepID=A0A7D6HVZ4_9MYCO|nr:DUF732 domain-containing protein [Mycobacterium vicinigordonae]QLL08712.1 DUF732 domain-containing protein [Mycobacterium vicinigordonae]
MTNRHTVIACMTVAAVIYGGAPAARADDESFFAAGRALGYQWSLDTMIEAGRSICDSLWRGRNIDEVTFHTKRYGLVTPQQAHDFVKLSVDEYCPNFRQFVSP